MSVSRDSKFYGWINLAGVMLVYGGLCGDITYAYGVFLPAMSETFHWNRATFSGPYVAFLVICGVLGPVVGMTIARFGAKKNIVLSNFIAVLGLLGMSQVSNIWHVYLFYGVMAGLGIAFGEFIAVTTVINHWFIRRRSLAMGFLFASGGIGGFVMPPLISWFILNLGWRWAWACLAGIHLLLTVVLGGLILRNRPEDIGQLPDGDHAADGSLRANGAQTVHGSVYQTATDWTVGQAMRTPALWMVMMLFTSILFVLNMLTTHQVAYLQDRSYSPMVSASALGLMLGMSIIGRLLSGILGIRFEGRHLAALFLGAMGLGVLALIAAHGSGFIYAYSILTGIGFGGMIVLMPTLISAYFGRTHYSQIAGWTAPIAMLGSAVSPSLAGYIHDATGQYVLPFGICAALAFAGIFIALLARPPKRPDTAS